MLIIESSEYLLQTDDAVSCVTVVTGITGPSFTAKDRKLIYQNYLDIQRRNQRLSPQENVQLLLCPIPNTTRMQVSTTRSNGMTLLMITWLNIFGVVLRLTWVSMQRIKQRWIFWWKLISFEEDCDKSLKTKTDSSVNGSSQRCASTEIDIFWKHLDN